LHDLAANLPDSADLNGIPVLLTTPELRPGFDQHSADWLVSQITNSRQGALKLGQVHLRPHGHAGGLEALGIAAHQIERGDVEAVIVAGVDSYFEADTVDWLEDNRQLMNATSRSAFVPGEGAAACLVTTPEFALRLDLPAGKPVLGYARAMEAATIKSDEVCLGHGLTEAVEQLTQRLPEDEVIAAIVSDHNGERYRSDEWGFMALRQGQRFADVTHYLAPAAWWGDLGAASGPLFATLSYFDDLLDSAPGTLLVASSESGLRAGLLLGERPIEKRAA
jgi:3-oxoacyl-[acyl-carrier-protein] synthase-1